MIEYIKKFEKMIILSLVVMMVLLVLLATLELGRIITKDIFTPPIFLLEIDELLDIFGHFMLVLIGIELLETITKNYLEKKAPFHPSSFNDAGYYRCSLARLPENYYENHFRSAGNNRQSRGIGEARMKIST